MKNGMCLVLACVSGERSRAGRHTFSSFCQFARPLRGRSSQLHEEVHGILVCGRVVLSIMREVTLGSLQ